MLRRKGWEGSGRGEMIGGRSIRREKNMMSKIPFLSVLPGIGNSLVEALNEQFDVQIRKQAAVK